MNHLKMYTPVLLLVINALSTLQQRENDENDENDVLRFNT